jgi:uncharacterized protein with PIN domain
MSRILKAYETRYRWLLQQVRARQLQRGVDWLVARARRMSADRKVPLSQSLTELCERLASRPAFRKGVAHAGPDRFYCDAGLGGLARWLRGAGYEALWEAGIDDDELLRRARQTQATILTTDSMLMERRLLRDRIIPGYWLPPTLSIPEQLALVFREFHLTARVPRCMSCGGELRPGDKEALREKIPPRTYRWLDEYFVCVSCGKLFWHGTHWQRIQKQLRSLTAAGTAPAVNGGAGPSGRAT